MSAHSRRSYALGSHRLQLRMSADVREQLEDFARKEDLPLGRAAVRLMRHGLEPEAAPVRRTGDAPGLTEELGLHNLIATEQVIKLLERIVRHGPGAADEVLVEAGRAAQSRLASGHGTGGSAR